MATNGNGASSDIPKLPMSEHNALVKRLAGLAASDMVSIIGAALRDHPDSAFSLDVDAPLTVDVYGTYGEIYTFVLDATHPQE